MKILETLIPALEERFAGRGMRKGVIGEPDVLFPAVHPEVGDIFIYDEGDEITIIVSGFMHVHFGTDEASSTELESTAAITRDIVQFLEDVFADRMIFWTRLGGFAGAGCSLGGANRTKSNLFVKKAVWTKPLTRW